MCNSPISDEKAADLGFYSTYNIFTVNKLGHRESKYKKECETMECQSLSKSIKCRRIAYADGKSNDKVQGDMVTEIVQGLSIRMKYMRIVLVVEYMRIIGERIMYGSVE